MQIAYIVDKPGVTARGTGDAIPGLEKGLIMSQRRGGSVFRFVPPFTTTEAQLDRAAAILDEAIGEVV